MMSPARALELHAYLARELANCAAAANRASAAALELDGRVAATSLVKICERLTELAAESERRAKQELDRATSSMVTMRARSEIERAAAENVRSTSAIGKVIGCVRAAEKHLEQMRERLAPVEAK